MKRWTPTAARRRRQGPVERRRWQGEKRRVVAGTIDPSRYLVVFLLLGLWSIRTAAQLSAPLCEWRSHPLAVRDPCPEFSWQAPGQRAARVKAARTAAALASQGRLVWDSGWREGDLPIIEYAGPTLENGIEYFWTVGVRFADGHEETSRPQRFRLAVEPMPHHLPGTRTFINFGGTPAFARDWLDLCFRLDAKTKGRGDILAVRYGLVCTMLLPHPSTGRALTGKAAALAKFCAAHKLGDGRSIPEPMFCHFAVDTKVRLHVGEERASQPIETRLCPGWDPRNDRNGDGRVDEAEFAHRVNPKAGARAPAEARIPVYYWGPPNDDFVMNVGHPLYRAFMARVWTPELCRDWDGVYFDTVPPDVPGAGRAAKVVEYPRRGKDADAWRQDLLRLFADVKTRLPEKIILGNAWDSRPMVLDGCQNEGWQAITLPFATWKQHLDHALELDRRGAMQLLQYNPVYDPELAEFGPKVAVSRDRDSLYGLATYLLVHGRFTYFAIGRHPYARVQELWFPAIKTDFGSPLGTMKLFAESAPPEADAPRRNKIRNGDFEEASPTNPDLPAAWLPAPPVTLDRRVVHTGRAAARISSPSRGINNINRQFVHLKPHTTYTLMAYVKTDGVDGDPGAQVYPYEFEGVKAGMLTWTGTGDWKEQRLVFRTADDGEGRINFRIYGAAGTAWFDDIRLIEGAAVRARVYARTFENALVLVRPYEGGSFGADTADTYALPAGMWRPLRADGTAVDPVQTIRLRNGEAAILMGKPTRHP